LPFANIGGDPEQEHFVDGVTESLTTDLSRIRGYKSRAATAIQSCITCTVLQGPQRVD
jgi:TolB-like protein